MDEIKTIFTLSEAAELLKCHVETLRRAIRRKELRAAKVGREYKISLDELQRYYKELGGGSMGKDGSRATRALQFADHSKMEEEAIKKLELLDHTIAGIREHLGAENITEYELNHIATELKKGLDMYHEAYWYRHNMNYIKDEKDSGRVIGKMEELTIIERNAEIKLIVELLLEDKSRAEIIIEAVKKYMEPGTTSEHFDKEETS